MFKLVLIPIFSALLLTAMAYNSRVKLVSHSKLIHSRRFFKFFFGWLSLSYFATVGFYLPQGQSNLPEDENVTNKKQEERVVAIPVFLSLGFLGAFLLCSQRKCPSPVQPRVWRYHRTKTVVRFWGRALLFIPCLAIMSVLHFREKSPFIVFSILIFTSYILFSTLTIKFSSLNYKKFNFFKKNEKLIAISPLFFIFQLVYVFNNSAVEKFVASPVLGGVLSIIGIVLYLFPYADSNETCSSTCFSLVSLPIVIKLVDEKAIDTQKIYDVISKYLPLSRIYLEKLSFGFKETESEMIVLNWEEYKEAELESQRAFLSGTIVHEIRRNFNGSNGYQRLAVVNFGDVVFETKGEDKALFPKAIPIENKKILKLIRLKESIRFKNLNQFVKKFDSVS